VNPIHQLLSIQTGIVLLPIAHPPMLTSAPSIHSAGIVLSDRVLSTSSTCAFSNTKKTPPEGIALDKSASSPSPLCRKEDERTVPVDSPIASIVF